MKKIIFISLLSIFILGSCNRNQPCKNSVAVTDTSLAESNITLSDFMFKSGNIITDKKFPPLVHSIEIFQHKNQFLLIDIRDSAEYVSGHIEGAYNISRNKILDFFKNEVNPAGYEKIAIIDDNGPLAVYVATLLRFSGYNNTYGLKFGMGAWNGKFTKNISKYLSNKYANRIDTNVVYRRQPGNLPNFNTDNIVELLGERLDLLLADTITNIYISADELFANLNDYFILAYWSKEKYEQGHISGSFQYDIRSELSLDIALNTLPTDKKIVVYCNTGHHAIAIVAYLKLLGYDAVSMMYGINSFMNIAFQKTAPGAAITDASVLSRDFPILEGEDRTSNPPKKERDKFADAISAYIQSGLFEEDIVLENLHSITIDSLLTDTLLIDTLLADTTIIQDINTPAYVRDNLDYQYEDENDNH